MSETQKRPRGRPHKGPGESIARPNLSLRLHRDLYARLHAAAERDGRSLAEEVARRLEDSFGPNELLKAALREVLAEDASEK